MTGNGEGDKWFDGDSYISAFTLPDFILGITEKAKQGNVEFDCYSSARVGSRYSVKYKAAEVKLQATSGPLGSPSDMPPIYTEEQLEALSENGMDMLRAIGNKYGVKDTSKKGLIEKILSAQLTSNEV